MIREASVDDLPLLAAITQETLPYWAKLFMAGDIRCLIRDGNIIGVIALKARETKTPTCRIAYVFILRYYRRLGLGQRLFRSVFNDLPPVAFVATCHESQLDVQCFLRSLGFVGEGLDNKNINFKRSLA